MTVVNERREGTVHSLELLTDNLPLIPRIYLSIQDYLLSILAVTIPIRFALPTFVPHYVANRKGRRREWERMTL